MRVVAHNGARILGGAERATVHLLAGLQSRGHDVLLLCNKEIVATFAEESGVESRIAVIGGDLSALYAIRFASALAREKPDAVIVGTWKKLFFASWAARHAAAKNVIARVGLESDKPRSAKYRYALRHWTDAVVVNSQRMVSSFAGLSGFGAERVRVVHNGVVAPVLQSAPGALRVQLGISAAAPVVGCIARLASQKRLDRLLRTMALLPVDTHCIIAGDGPERSALTALARTLRIHNRVHFLGHRENKGDVLAAINVFVVSSDQEGLSNAMLEAMAFGVPIVSTPVSGASEALCSDGSSDAPGLVTSFDERSIADSIDLFLNDRVRARLSGEAGRARAAAPFSVDRMLDQWENILATQFRK